MWKGGAERVYISWIALQLPSIIPGVIMGMQVAIFMLLISGGEVLGEERRRDRREVEDGGGREV